MNANLKQARLHCTFSVRYNHNGEQCVLQPGQVVPVYDGKKLARSGPDLDIVVVVLSVDEKGEFIAQPGLPALKRESYRTARDMLANKSANIDLALVVQQARLYALGGASGTTVIRPHRLPLGIGVFDDVVAWDDQRKQVESHTMTLAQAEPLRKLEERSSELLFPLPRFYIEAPDGKYEGVSVGVDTPGNVRLNELLLPVCPCPLGDDVEMMELLSKAVRHIYAMGNGRIWLGYEVAEAGAPEVDTVTREAVTAQQVRNAQGAAPVMYVLPHGGAEDYFAPLRFESRAKVNALYQGRDRLEDELLPMYSANAVDMDMVVPMALDTALADAGLPTS